MKLVTGTGRTSRLLRERELSESRHAASRSLLRLFLHQLSDESLRDVRGDAQRPVRQRAAFTGYRSQLTQRRQIPAPPEEAARDALAPQPALLQGAVQVGRVMAHLFELAGPLLEKVMRVVVVVGYAGTESVDQGEAFVLYTALD